MHQEGQELLAIQGYRQYEVSAYAKAEQRCAHNLNYWLFGDYLGIGAGAHGKITNAHMIRRTVKTKQPKAYLDQCATGHAMLSSRELSRKDVVLEFMMNALRLNTGFTMPLFTARTGLASDCVEPQLKQAEQQGLLRICDETVQTTGRGRLYLNDLLQAFVG
jgi:oxygen-independent coproporphyrinogen-3 oxidase